MKRILSLILAFCMITSLLPAVTFAAEPLKIYNYKISANSLTVSAKSDYGIAANKNFSNNDLAYISWKSKKDGALATLDPGLTDGFELVGRTTNDNSPQLYASGVSTQFKMSYYDYAKDAKTTYYTKTGTDGRPHFAVLLNIPRAGEYKISAVNNFSVDDAAIKGTINAYENNKDSFDQSLNDTGKMDTGIITQVYFAKAEDTYSKKGMGNVITNGIKLGLYDSRAFGEKTELGTVEVSSPGEYYLLFDTNEETFAENSAVYTRFNYTGEVLTSSNEWQIFCLSEIRLTPTNMPELASVSLEYDSENYTVKIASAKMSDGTDADLSDAEIKFSISGSDKITVNENTGKISPCMENVEVTVRADVALGEKSVYAVIPVTVKALEYSDYYLKYNFAVTEKTVRLDSAITEEMTKGFWLWGNSNKSISTLNATAQYIQLGTYKNDWVAVKLRIPAAGIYKTRLTYGVNASSHTGAGTGKLYVIPADTDDIANVIEEIETLGEVNFKGTSAAFENGKKQELANVVFDTPGEYYLVFSALGYTDNAHNMYPTAVEFIGGEELAAVSVFTNNNDFVIEEGSSEELSVETVWLSDYSEATTDEYTVSFKSANEDIATVTQNGRITGVSAGSTKIAVTVEYNGTRAERMVDVLVLQEGSSKYTVTYDFGTGDISEKGYEDTDNFWKGTGSASAEINVPVAGRYSFITDGWDGSVSVDDEPVNSSFTFPSAGNYEIFFHGGVPAKLTLYGGKELAPMDIRMKVTGTVAGVYEIVMSDGSVRNTNGADILYSIDDFSVASIDENTGKILPGKAGGKTYVRAAVTIGGFTVSGMAQVSFEPEEVKASGAVALYNFNTASDKWKNANYTAWDDNYSGATTWKINGITYDDTDGWAWHAASDDTVEYKASMWTSSGGASLKSAANGWVAIKIKIPAPGRYWATLTSSKSYEDSYGSANIFVIPVKDDPQDIETAFTPDNFVATLNCNDPGLSAAKAVTDELGAVHFGSAGDYLMVFRDTGGGKKVVPRILALNGQNGVRYSNFTLDSYELQVGDKVRADVSARLLDGTELTKDEATFVYASSNEEVATFIDGEIEALGDGQATLTFTAIYGTQKVSLERKINVTNTSEIIGIELVPAKKSDYAGKTIPLSARLNYEKGLPKRLDNVDVTYTITEGSAEIAEGKIKSDAPGKIKITATYNGITSEPVELEFKKGFSKSGSTYYTAERIAAARENIRKYDWAKSEYEKTVATAERYLPFVAEIFEVITGKGLPRSYTVGYRNDPDYVYCRYCGANAEEGYGGFTYSFDRLWKIQCPDCKRLFPSNDFELLYERGIVNGSYDVETARRNNAEAVARGEKDALTNELYPELYNPHSELYNKDPRTGDAIDGKMWGVDDGWGYHTGRTYDNGVEEVHTYVSYFAYKIPNFVASRAQDFGEAYLYTGDIKYGRAGAILLDRIADVYPGAFTNEFFHLGFATGGGGDDRGKFTGRIGDAERADTYALAADALYPYLQTEDKQLITELNALEEKLKYESVKTDHEQIWRNWADNLLWESFEAIRTCHLLGNTGYHQSAAAGIMLVLDEEPRSSEILDWLYTGAPAYGSGVMAYDSNPGGNVAHNFFELVDRDGMGNEAAPSYNLTWVFHFNDLAKYIRLYTSDSRYDLYKNPKYMLMFRAAAPIVLTKTHHPQIGDASSVATNEFLGNYQSVKEGFYYLKDTPVGSDIAEYIYLRNGDSEKGLHYDIFTKDPENMENDILSRVNGTTARDSEMLAGYGFAVLREGDEYGEKSSPTYVNNMRDFWIWFGPNGKWSHSHQDALNIGIESYGINMAPDLGYSEASGQLPSRWQWVRSTISHNTVVVNEKNQIDHGLRSQFPQHFDDSGDVKLMDVDASGAYNETSIYRRTLVMINAGDDVSYGVDFFRIKGGTDHLYSFHSQSDSVYSTEGLGEIHYQTDNGKADGSFIGTYAGENVSYGPDPSNSTVESRFTYRAGYTWMKDVRRAYDVGKFTIDYNVTDFRKLLKDSRDLHMRVTMLNDFRLSEVAMTKGHVPPKIENKPIPEQLEYMLARRTSENGESLDSLYTTVYEPYKGERYLKNMESVSVTTDEMAGTDDVAKAIKVIRKNADGTDGRVDYIVYATNNDVIYTVTDGNFSFDFRGFVGVYSINEDGVCIYSYVHDGDIIGERESVSKAKQYTGRVEKFTDMLTTENYIWIEPDGEAETSSFVGKYMFIDNDRVDNGVYKIVSAEPDSGLLKLGIGMTSVLRNYRDDTDVSLGYVYNIAKGQTATIPITNTVEFKPVFDEVKSTSVSAGNSLKINVSATTANGGLNYIGTNIPRGASVNSQTGEFAWKPDSSQVGENHVAITARDEYGRESTLHFTVTVYGSTAEKPSDGNATEKTPTEGSAGGGGGGGGAEPTDKPDDGTNKSDNKDTESLPLEEKVASAGEADEVEKPKFTDLGNHIWAEDSINTLAADGIIKGTSASTFSPANNITRADFALLLVRAFGLESEDTENFADVSASDYFAPELAIARNTGIVNGIGDNKYAPKNTITRQDMMVIVYRALQKLNVGFGIYDEPQYKDFTSVAEYAKPAVSTLIGAGLVNGKSGLIAPTDYTTRAEVAVLIRRILNYTK